MRGGRKGGLGGIPPAEPVNEISSDIFKYTPPTKDKSLMLDKLYNIWYRVCMNDSNIKKITVRNLQHNLATYLEMAKATPIIVTKHRKDAILMVNPIKYDYLEQKTRGYRVKDTDFIGMYKDRKDWKRLSNSEVANKLRDDSWYGK